VSKRTDYGFEWGVAKVERRFTTPKGTRVLGVTTPRADLQIAITPTGLVRIYDKQGREWKPVEVAP
jgi:hypothetical protein